VESEKKRVPKATTVAPRKARVRSQQPDTGAEMPFSYETPHPQLEVVMHAGGATLSVESADDVKVSPGSASNQRPQGAPHDARRGAVAGAAP
jgi:hypothetical protein